MDPAATPQHVLTVAGMHRSGSSLTANWLMACGLFIGDNLLENCPDNLKGHFEDMAFLDLHKAILADNDLDHLVNRNKDIRISDARHREAEDILTQRQSYPSWGWKEPRTALFLPFWKSLIPSLKFLVIYRPYEEVLHSLFKRERQKYKHRRFWHQWKFSMSNPFLTTSWLKVWAYYNQLILEITDQYPDDCMVFRIDDILQYSSLIGEAINGQWNFDLDVIDIKSIYQKELMTGKPSKNRWLDRLVPGCSLIYEQLELKRLNSLAAIHISA